MRERAAMIITSGIMAGLFLFWIFDFTMTGGGAVSDTASSTAPSPFSIITENVGSLIDGVKDQFKTE